MYIQQLDEAVKLSAELRRINMLLSQKDYIEQNQVTIPVKIPKDGGGNLEFCLTAQDILTSAHAARERILERLRSLGIYQDPLITPPR